MDNINDRLTAQANNDAYSPAICVALGIAKKILNHYYSRTDDSEAYRIAMSKWDCLSEYIFLLISSVLHLKYKLNYFKTAKWEQVWVDTAEELIRTEYRDKYEEDEASDSDTVEVRFSLFIFLGSDSQNWFPYQFLAYAGIKKKVKDGQYIRYNDTVLCHDVKVTRRTKQTW